MICPLRAPILDHMKVVCPRHAFPKDIIVRDTRLRNIVITNGFQRRLAPESILKLRNTSHHIKNRLSFNSGNSSAADMLEINNEVTDGDHDTFLFFSVKVSPERSIFNKTNEIIFET